MKVLVTGGAGYIGSVVVERLVEAGADVVAFDNLKSGWRAAVDPKAQLIVGDLLSPNDLDRAFADAQFSAACHLAAEVAVGESVVDPGLHYQANVVGSINLLDAMARHGVRQLVFSSTAALYGAPASLPIPESAPKLPANPYGESKLAVERALQWYESAHDLKHVSLRYFNACGATGSHGEYREKETHIVPILLETALGFRSKFTIFGDDFPTPDGSCVRDYVHVSDIADAHILALESLGKRGSNEFNIGLGRGFSNFEVAHATQQATGVAFPIEVGPRRAGDPPELVADANKIQNELGWRPKFTELDSMIASAWDWRKRHPKGY